jgi:hypothetical protein
VNQIFALSHLTVHNLTKLTIDKHSITNQVLRSPPTPPEMTSLYQRINQEHVHVHEQERAVEEFHSRWSPSSGSQVIVDRLPSQPLSHRHSRRGSASGRLQRINSKWTSGSGVVADSPPLQPLSRRRSDLGRLELSGTRWSSGSQASCDTVSSHATKQCIDSQEISCDEELWCI